MERIEHTIEPVYRSDSRVLILGTMPSPKSRKQGFYYGHPQNRFFPALAEVYGEPVPEGVSERKEFLLRHRIALWDVLRSCVISGASDASIRQPVPNDISIILQRADIKKIFTTGSMAFRLYGKLCQPDTGIEADLLPSPNPANCRLTMDDLVRSYSEIKRYTL
ncbi:MAG: DNA-deoxyinosine glycosylase [Clostridia bacterium]|nr:DNA-deoxyinosine glycosylase [Clostridia bacterium]